MFKTTLNHDLQVLVSPINPPVEQMLNASDILLLIMSYKQILHFMTRIIHQVTIKPQHNKGLR